MKNNNLKEIYFQRLEETTKQVYENIVSLIKQEYKNELLVKTILLLVKKRQKKLLARPFIVRLGYELAGGKKWKEIILPGILLEIENISTYQSNAAFDSKYGVANDELSKSNQIIAAFLTRNLIQKVIDEKIAKTKPKIAREFSKIVTEIDIFDYVGQFWELNYLGIENFDFNIDLKDYLNIYLKIKYLYGGVWIRDLLLTGILFSEEKTKLLTETIKKFGVYCGTPYTMVNDLSDFCLLKTERGYKTSIEDQFKDVWNGRVTLPLYYAISKYSLASKEEKNFLIDCMKKKHRKNLNNMKKIQKILIKSEALNFSYSLMNYLGKEAKRIIKKLPKSPERDMLIVLNTALRTNQFFYELKKEGMKIIELNPETVKYLENFWSSIVMRR